MSKWKKKLEIVDAFRLLYSITIHHPATQHSDEFDSLARSGDWLVTYNNGVQKVISDTEFKSDWEQIGQ